MTGQGHFCASELDFCPKDGFRTHPLTTLAAMLGYLRATNSSTNIARTPAFTGKE
jgi:hypothetical protein